MAVLRDVIANFMVTVNDRELSEFDKKLDKAKKKVKDFALTAAAGVAAVGYGAYKLVEAASDANEAMNVLETTFKGNTDAVIDWSKTVAEEMGRSEYSFQDSVGKMGAFLTAIFRGTDQDIEGMSKKLSELAVDLASFYNTTDAQAQQNIFSGMSGETEAVRKYGIDISDSALEKFNASQGDKRTMRSLGQQEKALLRFRKIMIDTQLAQGDAAKTAASWANQLKRLQERAKTISVEIGKKLIPIALKFLDAINDSITNFEKFYTFITDKTAILKAAVLTIGSLMSAMAITSVIANWAELSAAAVLFGDMLKTRILPSLGAAALMAAKFALAFLAIEDVVGFLDGKDSFIGRMLTEFTGLSEPLDAVKGAAESIMNAFGNAFTYAKNFLAILLDIPTHFNKIRSMMGLGGDDAEYRNLDQGTVDLDAVRARNESSRQTGWNAGVNGKLDKQAALDLAKNNRRPGESEQDAFQRLMSERKQAVQKGAKGLEVTNEDITAGNVDPEFIRAMTEYSSGKGGVATLGGTLRGETVNNIKIDVKQTNATPEHIQKAVEDGLEAAMRKTLATEDEGI